MICDIITNIQTPPMAVFFIFHIFINQGNYNMSRVLQIRRGTTAQNDNFTGMPGEISFDTDAKTLRVHDGEKLGGYALARADATNNAGDGIPSDECWADKIPDEIWAQKVAQFAPAAPKILTSRPLHIANHAHISYAFNETTPALFAAAFLQCYSPECGYAIGDLVSAFGTGTVGAPLPNTYVDKDGLHAVLMCGGQNFWVHHRETGEITNVTNDNWRIVFRVYC